LYGRCWRFSLGYCWLGLALSALLLLVLLSKLRSSVFKPHLVSNNHSAWFIMSGACVDLNLKLLFRFFSSFSVLFRCEFLSKLITEIEEH